MREMDMVQRPGMTVPGHSKVTEVVGQELKEAVGVGDEAVLPIEELVIEVCHRHQKECCSYVPAWREPHITSPAVQ